jgi:hypothetical protein
VLSGIREAYFFLTAFDFEFAFAFFLSAGAMLYGCRLVLVEPQTNAQRRVGCLGKRRVAFQFLFSISFVYGEHSRPAYSAMALK